ncbi:MAG: RluA family pseudouridine synthase [Spirochaetales bacterium]|nr:RluA family pseudouridine synthase [Spirochaetales bacterium]
MSSKNPSSSSPRRTSFPVGVNDEGRRADTVLFRLLPHQSASRLQKALREGDIRLNGKKITPATRLAQGMTLEVWTPLLEAAPEPAPSLSLPPDFSSWIVAFSHDLLVLNKPSGVLVHASDRRDGAVPHPTLDTWVKTWLQGKTEPGLSFYPGPLHRLDRLTSGLIVFSVSLNGARTFSAWLAEGLVQKTYLALMEGVFSGTLERQDPLKRDDRTRTSFAGGEKQAKTRFQALGNKNGETLALVNLEGGRTHQIRAHAALAGHPLVGDTKYLSKTRSPGAVSWWLHAWKLVLPDASLGEESYTAAPPAFWSARPWVRELVQSRDF